ncbi:hypothetical protein AAG570_001711 [Ranatra chinensis]|uniref:FAM69 protein-kinase domain-containing protein n=1 Tax=Ranatra chinensis TaxID=642074 RepID=A0ABD0Y9C0_9HEMI
MFRWDYCYCLIVLFLSFAIYKFLYNDIDIVHLCEIHKGPLVFGTDACDSVMKGVVDVKSTFLTKIIVVFGPKAVIRGNMNGEKIIMKTLGTKQEFESLEEDAKDIFSGDISTTSPANVKGVLLKALHLPLENRVPKLYLCFKPKNVDTFLVKLFDKYDLTNVENLINIWTSIIVNPEPLVLQILRPPKWPVPRYYGSCGRLAVFEDCGERLTLFYDAPWSLRANLTVQVLSAAFEFTFAHPTFTFYLTDMTADNIVVDDEGRARFIDLENVIILDKISDPAGELKLQSQNHTSDADECTSCFSYSIDDICGHRISDHNIYGVCKVRNNFY